MPVIAVANVKGGVGKTSVSTALAIYFAGRGRDVLLVDADPQETASDFTSYRAEVHGEAGYTIARYRLGEISKNVLKLAPKHHDVIIDVGGTQGDERHSSLRHALAVAEIALVPIFPGAFDLWSTDRMAHLVRDARIPNPRLQAWSFLCRADAVGSDNRVVADALRETEGISYADAPLVTRKAWRNAQAEGRAIWEMKKPDEKAVAEFEALVAVTGAYRSDK